MLIICNNFTINLPRIASFRVEGSTLKFFEEVSKDSAYIQVKYDASTAADAAYWAVIQASSTGMHSVRI